MAQEAPSTAPTPLDESLKKFLGGAGTAPLLPNQVTYGNPAEPGGIGYDPETQFRPEGDILTINAAPGTGASTAETWAHELDVERQRQEALEFEFQQRQAAEDQARQQAQLEMQQAEASRAAALGGPQLEAAQLANQATQQQMGIAQSAEQRALADTYFKYGGFTPAMMEKYKQNIIDYNTVMHNSPYTPSTPVTSASYAEIQSRPSYTPSNTYIPNVGTFNQPMIRTGPAGGAYGGYTPAAAAPRYMQSGQGQVRYAYPTSLVYGQKAPLKFY